MPKSWYFEVSHSSTRPYLAQVVETALKDSNEKVLFSGGSGRAKPVYAY